MPKAGQTLHGIERVENASALASEGRQKLDQLEEMLNSIHARRTSLSDYNLSTAQDDLATVRSILWALQTEICRFRGGKDAPA